MPLVKLFFEFGIASIAESATPLLTGWEVEAQTFAGVGAMHFSKMSKPVWPEKVLKFFSKSSPIPFAS